MRWLYEGASAVPFLVLTVFLGGGAGWLTGRAVALTWRPVLQLVAYALLLAAAVRFLHFALGEGRLLSAHYYAVDFAVALVGAGLGFRRTRTRQMVRQYGWLYAPAGPLSWRPRPGPKPGDAAA